MSYRKSRKFDVIKNHSFGYHRAGYKRIEVMNTSSICASVAQSSRTKEMENEIDKIINRSKGFYDALK